MQIFFNSILRFVFLFFAGCFVSPLIAENVSVVNWNLQTFFDGNTDGCEYSQFKKNDNWNSTAYTARLTRLCDAIQDMNADIPKIAVMPQNKKDVLTLLAATEEMTTNYADRPIITMSMAGTGVISRLCGEVFGSSMTFGAAKKASVPGQMGVNDLNTVLGLLHNAM